MAFTVFLTSFLPYYIIIKLLLKLFLFGLLSFMNMGKVLKTSLHIHGHLTHFYSPLIVRDSICKGEEYSWKEKFALVTSRGNGPLKGQSRDTVSFSNPAKRLIGKIKIEKYNYSNFISSLRKSKIRQGLHNPDSQVYISLSDLHDLKHMEALVVKLSE